MASTMQSPVETKRFSISNFIESAAKSVTLLILTSYALGYLILVIDDNAHGFFETNLIKPKAITTGAVFMFLIGLPISITQGTFFGAGSEPESKLQTLARVVVGSVDYLAACSAAALGMLLILTDDLHRGPPNFGIALAFLGLFCVVAINGILRFAAPRSYRSAPKAWIVIGILSLAGLAISIYILRFFAITRCLLWMFGVASLVNPYLSDIRRGIKVSFKPIVLGMILLGALATYTHYLFPDIKGSLGGGEPLASVFYISKEAPVHAGEKVKAVLLEASDSGFYIIFDGDNNATFIPRTLVTAIEFPAVSKH
ncbi:MAG TPA: hypothetical protein VKL99_12625 [Candidatus Angelobacter sp.]|nr:hypothetical protein [Candidatus Angelobacter sp.]